MNQRGMLTRSGGAWLVGMGLAVGLMLAAGGSGGADERLSAANSDTATTSPKFFKVCEGQTYALCAVASCFVFNAQAYCKCDVKSGDSISLPFEFDDGEDVCTVNAEGAKNGYMVSTFSVPDSVLPGGDRSTRARPAPQMEPTPSATAGSASPAARGNRFRVSTHPWRKTRSSAPARSPWPTRPRRF